MYKTCTEQVCQRHITNVQLRKLEMLARCLIMLNKSLFCKLINRRVAAIRLHLDFLTILVFLHQSMHFCLLFHVNKLILLNFIGLSIYWSEPKSLFLTQMQPYGCNVAAIGLYLSADTTLWPQRFFKGFWTATTLWLQRCGHKVASEPRCNPMAAKLFFSFEHCGCISPDCYKFYSVLKLFGAILTFFKTDWIHKSLSCVRVLVLCLCLTAFIFCKRLKLSKRSPVKFVSVAMQPYGRNPSKCSSPAVTIITGKKSTRTNVCRFAVGVSE